MAEYVWVSALFKTATLNRGWDIDLFHDGNTGDGSLLFANKNGLPIAPEMRPHKIWANSDDPPIKKLPPVFNIGYALLIEQDLTSVFDHADLGEGDILPMDDGIYQADQSTRYAKNYASWVIGNKKSAVLLDETVAKSKLNPMSAAWHLDSSLALTDDTVAVSREALVGPDQWVDPLLQGSLFFSGTLGDRIAEAGLRNAFFMHQCRVI